MGLLCNFTNVLSVVRASADKVIHWRFGGWDQMDIAGGLLAATEAVKIAKALRDVDKAYDQVVLKGQIVELMDSLLDVKTALQDAREGMSERDSEIARLLEAADRRASTVMKGGHRYTSDPEDSSKPVGPPFCQRCEDVDKRMVMTVSTRGLGAQCPQCKTAYAHVQMFLWPDQRG
jgi:hypothetical protein